MTHFVDLITKSVKVSPDNATHFAIYSDNMVRYYVAMTEGMGRKAGRRLSKSVSAYSGKLGMLMKLLGIVPYRILQIAHIGEFVKLKVDDQVDNSITRVQRDVLNEDNVWYNVIVGSYIEKQKVVFQCFGENQNSLAVYIKVGGCKASNEMLAEATYLKNPIDSPFFVNPKLCFAEQISDGKKYNIQVTEEFSGKRVKPEFTSEIYKIYGTISNSQKQVLPNGKVLTFSHGDFTPWNMKKENGTYILFDWEYCGMRFYGFDLIHFLWQVENKLHGKDNNAAIESALIHAKLIDIKLNEFENELLEQLYYEELHKQFDGVL